jgi:hypothetical protein
MVMDFPALRFWLLVWVLVLALPVLLTTQAHAADAQVVRPLVTIRFNQPNVHFEQSLYNALAKAAAAKPQVAFDVVSYAPTTGNAEKDKAWQAIAGRNTRAIIAAMGEMGVPKNRISVSVQFVMGLTSDETRIYVR